MMPGIPESVNDDSMKTTIVGLFIAMSCLFLGIASISYQISRLRKRINNVSSHQWNTEPTSEAMKSDLNQLEHTFRASRRKMQEEVDAEVEKMRELQRNVSTQLDQLREVVTMFAALQEQRQEETSQLGSVGSKTKQDSRRNLPDPRKGLPKKND